MHENKVEFEVYGPYALFSDPVTRVGGEKCTYQIPTYEAIKGVLHSIYWKPTIIWIIDEVRVMNPVQMESKGVRPIKYKRSRKREEAENDLSYYTYLKDCRYQVRAHFIFNDNRPELAADRNENKHHNIAKRAVQKGGRRDVFLGTRECQAYVAPCVFGEGKGYYDDIPLMSFGRMVHGFTYPDEAYSEETKGKLTVRFWNAEMRNGVIRFPKPWECIGNNQRIIKEYSMKPFGREHENIKSVEEEESELAAKVYSDV